VYLAREHETCNLQAHLRFLLQRCAKLMASCDFVFLRSLQLPKKGRRTHPTPTVHTLSTLSGWPLSTMMGNRKISDNIKQCALDLWNHGWVLEEICEVLQVSKCSCYRWQTIFEELGTVSQPPSPLVRRTRLLTRAVLTALEYLYAEESDLFLDEACTWLGVVHGITITLSTLSRNLLDAGLTRKKLRKIAAERNEIACEEFRTMLQTEFIGDGSEFVVIDETSKDKCTYA